MIIKASNPDLRWIARLLYCPLIAFATLPEENWLAFNHTDEVTRAVGELLGVDLSRKYLKSGEIKKFWAQKKA